MSTPELHPPLQLHHHHLSRSDHDPLSQPGTAGPNGVDENTRRETLVSASDGAPEENTTSKLRKATELPSWTLLDTSSESDAGHDSENEIDYLDETPTVDAIDYQENLPPDSKRGPPRSKKRGSRVVSIDQDLQPVYSSDDRWRWRHFPTVALHTEEQTPPSPKLPKDDSLVDSSSQSQTENPFPSSVFVQVPAYPRSLEANSHDIPNSTHGLGKPEMVGDGGVNGVLPEREASAAPRKDEILDLSLDDRSPSPVEALPVLSTLTEPGPAAEMVGPHEKNPSSRSTAPKPSQSRSFLGVVITQSAHKRPPKKRRLSSSATSASESGPQRQTLVSALAQAFQSNSNVVAPVERGTTRPSAPRAKRPFVPPQRTPMAVEPRMRPPPLRPADIAATLETREATVRVLKVGGPGLYNAEAWDNFTYGSKAGWRRRMNLRFVEAAAHIEGQGEWESGKKRERAVAVSSKSRRELFAERMDAMFGPGSVHRGMGPKPKEKRRVEGNKNSAFVYDTGSSRAGSVSTDELGNGIMSILGKRRRSLEIEEEEDDYEQMPVMLEDDRLEFDKASAWAMALQKLIKGKTPITKGELLELGTVLDEIEDAKNRLTIKELQESRLRECVEQLSRLEEIPYGDEQGLQARGLRLALFWRGKGSNT